MEKISHWAIKYINQYDDGAYIAQGFGLDSQVPDFTGKLCALFLLYNVDNV